jgi:hypothetical protein
VQRIKHGPPIDELREEALSRIDVAFDKRFRGTAVRQSVYDDKIAEAGNVVNGGVSEFLEAEARIKKIKVEDLAKEVLGNRDARRATELERMEVRQKVKEAKTVSDILTITKAYGA